MFLYYVNRFFCDHLARSSFQQHSNVPFTIKTPNRATLFTRLWEPTESTLSHFMPVLLYHIGREDIKFLHVLIPFVVVSQNIKAVLNPIRSVVDTSSSACSIWYNMTCSQESKTIWI